MSTRSYIGKVNPDSTIEYVYCHFDGSPEIVGHLLLDHYQDAGKIDKLLALGWLSSLGRKMTKPANCNYNGNIRCITYHRDHGMTGIRSSQGSPRTPTISRPASATP